MKSSYTEEFELFFRCYPPRFNETRNVWIRADKPGAWLEWQKLTDDQKITVLKLVQKEKAGKYTPDARKWLHHKPWEDNIANYKQDFQRPLIKEVQALINKMVGSIPSVPPIKISNYELNQKRNQNLDKLKAEL